MADVQQRFVAIPLRNCEENEVIEINIDDLPKGEEVLSILLEEKASLHFWLTIGLEYYRQKRYDEFVLLFEASGHEAALDYNHVQQDQMKALDCLAGFYLCESNRTKDEEQKRSLFAKSNVLFNTADKICMYDHNHLTIRAWYHVHDRDERNKLDLADQQFNFVIKQTPTNALAAIGKAIISYYKRDYKSAIYYYRKVLQHMPDTLADLRVGLAYCFSRMGKPNMTKIAFERALELDPDNVNAITGLAIVHVNTHIEENIQKAVSLLGRAYKIKPENPATLIHLANHFFYKKLYARTEKLALHAFQMSDSNQLKAEACFQLARVRHVQDDFDSAFKYYYQAMTMSEGELTLAHFGLGKLYIQRGEIEEAVDCFQTVLKRVPNNPETLKILGSLYAHAPIHEKNNDYRRKGVETLQKYLELIPEDVEAMIDLAQLLEATEAKKSLHLYERAVQILQESENIDPQPEMINNIGSLYMNLGNYEQAKKHFEQAISRFQSMINDGDRPDSDRQHLLTVRYNLARNLEYLYRTSEAERLYKDIIAECPNYVDCYMRLGCLTRDRGQIHESSVWFKQSLSFDQSSADAWTLIANLHVAKQEWLPAQKKFEHILEKLQGNQHDQYAMVSLGNVWLEQVMNPNRKKEDLQKNLDRAFAMFAKTLKRNPKNIYASNGIACLLALAGDAESAREGFTAIREVTSDIYDVWVNIGHLYMESNQFVSAVQIYSSAMTKFRKQTDPSLLHHLAKAYFKADMLPESKECLEKAIIELPDNIHVKYNYAVVLKRMAKQVLKNSKATTEQVQGVNDDLQTAERIYTYISKNEDLSLPGAKLLSRTMCREEAKYCQDLLIQANTALARAQKQDEEERRMKAKQEEEKLLLEERMEEARRAEEELKKQKEEREKTLRSTFVEMTKDILKLPEVVEEKRGGGGGRRKKGGDGDEFVNDSSDDGGYEEEDVLDEDGQPTGEKRRKEKPKKSKKKRERRGGSDDESKAERKKRRKEEKERKAAEKLSAKQSAKIKSRAYVSSDDSSSDDGKPSRSNNFNDDEDEEPPRIRDEFADSPEPPIIGDSDSDQSDEPKAKPKKKQKVTMDSDNSSGEEDAPIIGASDSDGDGAGPSKRPNESDSDNSGTDAPKKKKKRAVSSDSEQSD